MRGHPETIEMLGQQCKVRNHFDDDFSSLRVVRYEDATLGKVTVSGIQLSLNRDSGEQRWYAMMGLGPDRTLWHNLGGPDHAPEPTAEALDARLRKTLKHIVKTLNKALKKLDGR